MARTLSQSRQDPAYNLHPSVAYVQAILDNLEARSGRDLAAWVSLVQAKGPADRKDRSAWLKAQGLGATQASFVAERSMGGDTHAFDSTPEGYLAAAPRYVEGQYSGKKAVHRPLFERLVALARSLGPDVKVCPCETIVPFYRNHVFAEAKPFAARLDLGLALGDPAAVKAPAGRLKDTGGFAKNNRITHRLEVATAVDLDATLTTWLRRAYERDGD